MNRLRELRMANNMRQADLAKLLNTKPQTVSRYEIGDRGLDVETIARLCEIFGCTSDYLLGLSNNPSPVISDADAAMLQAFHAAPPSVAAAITTLLQPYSREKEADQVI